MAEVRELHREWLGVTGVYGPTNERFYPTGASFLAAKRLACCSGSTVALLKDEAAHY
jgi:hypothetical protein